MEKKHPALVVKDLRKRFGFIAAMIFPMILVFIIARGFRWCGNRWLAHLRPRPLLSHAMNLL
jgi:hypothetical protein